MEKLLGVVLCVLALSAAGVPARAADPARARDDVAAGLKLLDAHQPNSAVIRFRDAVAADPGNGKAQFELAVALLRTGALPEVEAHLHAAQDAGYDADEVAATLADLLVRQEKFGRVLDDIPEGHRRPDLEVRIRTARGYAQLNLRQSAEAERAFRQAIDIAANALAPKPATGDGAPRQEDMRALRQGMAIAETGLAQTRIIAGDLDGAADLLVKATAADPGRVEPWILLGRVAALQNKSAAAREAFDKAIAIAPNNVAALLGRASLLVASDDKQAAADVAAILAQAPDNWRANLLDAIIKARHQQWRAAEAALMTIPAPEQLPKALYMLARVNLAQGQLAQADTNITHYLAIAPADPAGLAVKAEVLAELGKPAGAVDLLKQALARKPNDRSLLALLSDAYARAGQAKEAAATLDRLSAIAPRDAATRVQLARQRLAIGDVGDALGDLAIARAIAPLSPEATSLEIEALLKAGRTDDAQAAAEELRRQSPESAVAETYLGIIALRKGGAAAARPHFEKALALQPGFVTAAIDLAQTYHLERRFDEARAVYDRALKSQPNSVPLLMARADLERAAGKPDATLAWLERARGADDRATEPRFRLVQAYLARKEPEKAIAAARELARIAPRDPRAVSALAEAELAGNDRQTAIADFNRVIDMTSNAPEPMLRLADVLATGGDVQSGYGVMRRALDANPGDPQVERAFLAFSVNTGTVGAGIDFVRDLEPRHPADLGLVLLLGELYEADRKFDGAASTYRTALATHDDGRLLRGLARAEAHSAGLDTALATLAAWLAGHPGDRETRLMHAAMLESAKRDGAAIAEYDVLLKQNGKDALVLNNLAALYQAKDAGRAAALAEEAHALMPQSPMIADTLGWILVQKGDTARALTLLRQAAASPDLAPAPGAATRYHLAVALSRSGQRDEARAVLGKVLQSGTQFSDLGAAQALMNQLGG